MNQRDAWASMFAEALTASHHRDWSEDMIEEAALICADCALKVMADYQTRAQAQADRAAAVPAVHEGSETETGFL